MPAIYARLLILPLLLRFEVLIFIFVALLQHHLPHYIEFFTKLLKNTYIYPKYEKILQYKYSMSAKYFF